jgi:hypothetical protein
LPGKQRQASFAQAARFRAEEHLELVHGDLCGPISPTTAGGKKYFLLLVVDATRYMWISLPATKDEAAAAIKRILAEAESESGKMLRILRTIASRSSRRVLSQPTEPS